VEYVYILTCKQKKKNIYFHNHTQIQTHTNTLNTHTHKTRRSNRNIYKKEKGSFFFFSFQSRNRNHTCAESIVARDGGIEALEGFTAERDWEMALFKEEVDEDWDNEELDLNFFPTPSTFKFKGLKCESKEYPTDII
jgi:hypothetical protein